MVLSVFGKLESTRLRIPSADPVCVIIRWTKRNTVLSGVVALNLMVSVCQRGSGGMESVPSDSA